MLAGVGRDLKAVARSFQRVHRQLFLQDADWGGADDANSVKARLERADAWNGISNASGHAGYDESAALSRARSYSRGRSCCSIASSRRPRSPFQTLYSSRITVVV